MYNSIINEGSIYKNKDCDTFFYVVENLSKNYCLSIPVYTDLNKRSNVRYLICMINGEKFYFDCRFFDKIERQNTNNELFYVFSFKNYGKLNLRIYKMNNIYKSECYNTGGICECKKVVKRGKTPKKKKIVRYRTSLPKELVNPYKWYRKI